MARYNTYKILLDLEKNKKFASELLDNLFKNSYFSPVNKSLITELVYGITRYKKRLDYVIAQIMEQKNPTLNYKSLNPEIKTALKIGAYQLLFLNKIPDYAAVNESVKLAKKIKQKKLINSILRKIAATKNNLSFPKEQLKFLSVFYSHPEWLVKRWCKNFGLAKTTGICQVNNTIPPLTLRVNILKNSLASFCEQLSSEKIKIISTQKNLATVTVKKLNSLENLSAFQNGLFYIQDETAVKIGKLLSPKPGNIVLDLCAGPGGKTTHLAELMENKGKIIALDVSSQKIKLLKDNLKRLSITMVEYFVYNGNSPDKFLQNIKFDKILIDAPCSNTGVFRRRIEARWHLSERKIRKLSKLQNELLEKSVPYLKPKGTLVYSTCSIEQEENEQVIRRFLQKHQDFKLETELFVLPQKEAPDGGYAAKLQKSAL